MSAQSGSFDSSDARSSYSPVTTPTTAPPGRVHHIQSSHWTPASTEYHHQGTSYLSNRAVSPSPRQGPLSRSTSANSARHRTARSNSISSAIRGDIGFSEEEEEEEAEEDYRTRITEQGEAATVDDGDESEHEEDPITLKDRQSLINVEHPFGLRIWKPALYKKSRSVTRYADQALHSVPSAQAERHLLPGNIFWVVFFGWWLSLACVTIAALLYLVPYGGRQYATLVYGLGWYIAWPFGKYVEGDIHTDEERGSPEHETQEDETDDGGATPRGAHAQSIITPRSPAVRHNLSSSWNSIPTEETSLLSTHPIVQSRHPKSYGTASPFSIESSQFLESSTSHLLGKACFWLALICVIAPLMLIVCIVCWAAVFTIPMAKLNWALIKHLFQHPTSIRFCSAPAGIAVPVLSPEAADEDSPNTPTPSAFTVKRARLSAGQAAPSGSPTSTVLLCIYRATGAQYYKYTVGGVNILFVDLIPIVFFVIFDGWLLLPFVEARHEAGKHVPAIIEFLASRAVIFILCLASVIPLSYFIGMAVASISAQSSIGMGAVINATFGSLVEILLYSFALTEGKGRLVEGSIVGSLLAGVLLMPGMSMCASAVRRKEQKFNSKSAGVTSMMLIMAFIGTLTPTLFYQTYGSFTLICDQCPPHTPEGEVSWKCQHCYYRHPYPMEDPFYQSTVKQLTFFCAGVLLFSYLIGLWFSLRTHASQIWQNPRQLLHPELSNLAPPRMSIYHKLVPGVANRVPPESLQHKPSLVNTVQTSSSTTPVPKVQDQTTAERRVSYAVPSSSHPASYSPILETVDRAIQNTGLQPMQLPDNMTRDDFTRAVAVATVSALRHQEAHPSTSSRLRSSATEAEEAGGHGGHDAPSWSRIVSASVLLGCTALYAIIAELLVDVVDVVLEGSGIDEKFLGVTLFALVPNTTEFMNAISFALNGNIALSMEIGSAYALQVCLLQIPAMVAFSAWFAPEKLGSVADTFTLIFPRWDVIVIILSVFLMTYTYIEAKSNYHRGSILILSYLVLTAGFYLAPNADPNESTVQTPANLSPLQAFGQFFVI